MPGTWGHLAARFFDVVAARDLDAGEMGMVRQWLGEGPALNAFTSQPAADQRHGFGSAAYVAADRPDRPDLIRAALLHDIGKRHARLGPIGRVVASILIRLRLPLGPRLALYRDHGLLSASELAGEEKVVIEFARHHHGTRPPTIEADEWALLVESDRARSPFAGVSPSRGH